MNETRLVPVGPGPTEPEPTMEPTEPTMVEPTVPSTMTTTMATTSEPTMARRT